MNRQVIISTFAAPLLICASSSFAIDRLVPSQYKTIQSAIDAAENGDTVIISPGTYTGHGNRDIDFKGKAINVRSTDPNDPNVVLATVVDCQGSAGDPHRGFKFVSGEGASSVLAGLTITRGYAPEEAIYKGCNMSFGGGICCLTGRPTISHCFITNCSADDVGGGIYGSATIIINCTIKGNRANVFGGGLAYCFGNIRNCIITSNTAAYAGGGLEGCHDGKVEDCLISENRAGEDGGGINNSDSIISNCVIMGNVAGEDGGGGYGCDRIANCYIIGNSAGGRGGGLDNYGGNISNCTIVGNKATAGGGGLFWGGGDIINCIVWGNSTPQIRSDRNVLYSDVQGGYAGVGNIDLDPRFASPAQGDYHLLRGSPCINAGDPNHTGPPGETDIDGDPRVMGGRIDMGADELIAAMIPIIGIHPTRFAFSANEGMSNPEPQVLSIRNIGSGILNWEIAEDCPWFSVDVKSGSSTVETDYVTLYVDISGLTGGSYICQLTISEPNAVNSPQHVGVNLTVHGPALGLSAPRFEFVAEEGGPNPSSQQLTIKNSGWGTLIWEISKKCTWVHVSPDAGTSSRWQTKDVTLSVDIADLPAGDHYCELMASDPNAENTPQTVTIALYIRPGGSGLQLYVPSEYSTIQAAINTASNGDAVIIAPGTYTGDGNRDIDFKGKAITVRSIDPNDPNIVAATVIDCEKQGGGFYLNGCAGAAISGLTITKGYADAGGGIYIEDSNDVTIANCQIIGNVTKAGENETPVKPAGVGGDGAGIYCSNSSVVIRDCNITLNNCGAGGGTLVNYDYPRPIAGRGGNGAGICAERSTVTIRNCTISGNNTGAGGNPAYGGDGGAGGKGGGICCLTFSSVTVEGCTVADNDAGDGGGLEYGAGDGGAGGGVYCDASSLLAISRTIVRSNRGGAGGESEHSGRPGADGGGICCLSESPLTIMGCTIADNVTDLGGYGCLGQCRERCGYGGGIYCRSAIIEGSTISNNIAGKVRGNKWLSAGSGGNGGGIYCSDSLTLDDCTIRGNRAGDGGEVHGDGYSGGSGGGVYCRDAVILGCQIFGNSSGNGGPGAWDYGAGAGSGGGVYAELLAIANSLVVRNATGNGGNRPRGGGHGGNGAGFWCGSAAITNCTIVGNFTGQGGWVSAALRGKGGGVFAKRTVSIKDSIVWDNSPEQLFGHDCNNVSYCNIGDEVCIGGPGNISLDPLFIQPGHWTDANDPNRIVEPNAPNAVWVMGDYHLSQVAAGQGLDSPCVDSGSGLAGTVGMDKFTTRTDKVADTGIVDMGYHYIEHIADFNGDGVIDGQDMSILAYQWQQEPGEPSADITPLAGDGLVDLRDLALLAENWLWPNE